MPSNTPNLNLYKKNPVTDGEDTFNIETMINENLDKVDAKFGATIGHGHTGVVGDGPKITASGLANGAATDTVIGNRTITDTTAPTGDTAAPTTLFSWLGYMIKSITGGATWRTAPGMTIAAIKLILDAAVSIATPSTLIKRDAAGRAKVAAPAAADDIARKDTVDAAITTATNAGAALSIPLVQKGVAGGVPAFDVNKNVITDGLVGSSSVASKVFTVEFANGVANQKVDVYFTGGLSGIIDISVTGMYNYAQGQGIVKKRIDIVAQNTVTINNQDPRYIEVTGKTREQISISNLAWDAVNNRWKITIECRTSSGNIYTIKVDTVSPGNTPANLQMSAVYTGAVTTLPQAIQVIPDDTVTQSGAKVWHAGNDGSGSGMDTDLVRGQAPNTGSAANTIVARDATGTTGVVNLTLNDTGRVAGFSAMTAAGFGGILQMTSDSSAAGGYGAWVCYNCYYNGTSWVQPRGSLGSFAYSVNYHRNFSWRFAAAGGVDGGAITLLEVAMMNSVGDFSARKFISTVPTGTPPATVASTSTVINFSSDLHDGFHASQSALANTSAVRDANKKIAEVAANRAVTKELQLTNTAAIVVATVTSPPVATMYTVKTCLVITVARTVSISVFYVNTQGITTERIVLPPTAMAIGCWDFIPVTVVAAGANTMNVVATTTVADSAYVSAVITEEG